MEAIKYVAFLRGINVGGKNRLPMAELRAAFEDAGFTNAKTYIQSGNIIFDAGAENDTPLAEKLTVLVKNRFFETPVLVRPIDVLKKIIANNPFPEFDEKQLHVVFTDCQRSKDDLNLLWKEAKAGEEYAIDGKEIYCNLRNGVLESLVGKRFLEKHFGNRITARNMRTLNKIIELSG